MWLQCGGLAFSKWQKLCKAISNKLLIIILTVLQQEFRVRDFSWVPPPPPPISLYRSLGSRDSKDTSHQRLHTALLQDKGSGQIHTRIGQGQSLPLPLSSSLAGKVSPPWSPMQVVIGVLPALHLEPHLDDLVSSVLSWGEDSKNHFRLKARVILERLVRKFG